MSEPNMPTGTPQDKGRAHRDGSAWDANYGVIGTVVMTTVFGGAHIVDTQVGEQLPKIC